VAIEKLGLKEVEFVDSFFFVYILLQTAFQVRKDIKEALMFQVTTKASEKIQEFFKDRQEEANIRIFLSQGG
jgi:hypothetical protein